MKTSKIHYEIKKLDPTEYTAKYLAHGYWEEDGTKYTNGGLQYACNSLREARAALQEMKANYGNTMYI